MAAVTNYGLYGTSRGGPFGDYSGKTEAEPVEEEGRDQGQARHTLLAYKQGIKPE